MTTETESTAVFDPRDCTMQYDRDHWFPFVEDENANITGPGHQDRAEFARQVNRYDQVATGDCIAEEDMWSERDINHSWATLGADGESLHPCTSDTPGAIAVTTLWGAR